jgi:ABC-type nickel/cobalt efflux system permease component RcnA
VLSLVIAVGLGALHALEPGHGKTLVAAYLVGSRGTARQALWLGLTVTASHTIGVFALGAVALFASHYVVPEQLYPWLELTSGVLIVAMGMTLLQRMWRHDHGSVADGHTQAHGHTSHHHYHGHTPHHHHTHGYGQHMHTHDDHDRLQHGRTLEEPHEVSYGTLLTLGVTGGMIPCPGALVVLLSAVALQRIAWGILLIVAFSLGLAAVLVATGLLLVSARGIMQRWSGGGPWLSYLPFLSPVVMIPLGLLLTVQALQRTGLLPALPL